MARFLITGATGALGQMLVPELARNGIEVICLIRPQRGETPDSRLSRLNLDKELVSCVSGGDIKEALCGVSPSDVSRLRGKIDTIIHSAAIVKFDEELREETLTTNIGGTREILKLAKELDVPRFAYVSTAYVAGGADKFTEDDIDIGQNLRNPYEESKLAAEKLVREWGAENAVSILVLRPSILVGRSTDGLTPDFNGFYGFYSGFARIKNRLHKKKTRNGADGLFPTSIENGKLVIDLPVEFSMGAACTINLIQLDWVVDVAVKLMKKGSTGTYFLSHHEPLTIRVMTSHILGRFGYRGFSFREPGAYTNAFSRIQKNINALINTYSPYVSHEALFVSRNAKAELGSMFVPPPRTDIAFLDVLIDYAEKAEWGKK